jgi:hypothetical protein
MWSELMWSELMWSELMWSELMWSELMWRLPREGRNNSNQDEAQGYAGKSGQGRAVAQGRERHATS